MAGNEKGRVRLEQGILGVWQGTMANVTYYIKYKTRHRVNKVVAQAAKWSSQESKEKS